MVAIIKVVNSEVYIRLYNSLEVPEKYFNSHKIINFSGHNAKHIKVLGIENNEFKLELGVNKEPKQMDISEFFDCLKTGKLSLQNKQELSKSEKTSDAKASEYISAIHKELKRLQEEIKNTGKLSEEIRKMEEEKCTIEQLTGHTNMAFPLTKDSSNNSRDPNAS